MQTITKAKIRTVLNEVIKTRGKATNKEIMLILRELKYFATQGMVVGFTNQIFNEEPHNYEKMYDEINSVLVYTAKAARYECYDKNNEAGRRAITSPTASSARSQFAKESGVRYVDVKATRLMV